MPDANATLIRTPLTQRMLLPGAMALVAIAGLAAGAGSGGGLPSLSVGLLAGAAVLFALSSRNTLELSDKGLVIRSLFGTGTLPWVNIDDIEVGDVFGGRGLTVMAFGKPTRLRVPRAGRAFWADHEFDAKVDMVLAAWKAGAAGQPVNPDGPRRVPKATRRTTPKSKKSPGDR